MSDTIMEETSKDEWLIHHSEDFPDNIQIGYKKSDKKQEEEFIIKTLDCKKESERIYIIDSIVEILKIKLSKVKNLVLPYMYSKRQRGDSYQLSLYMHKQKDSLYNIITQRRRNEKYFTSTELKDLIKQTFGQMENLAKIDIAHKNIKAQNVLLSVEQQWRFSDTGYASLKDEEKTIYQAPEIEFNKSSLMENKSSKFSNEGLILQDVYSLGIIYVKAAVLKKDKDLKFLQEDTTESIEQQQQLEKEISKRYGVELLQLLKKMIAPLKKRKTFENIREDGFIQSYMESADIYDGENKVGTELSQKVKDVYERVFKDMHRCALKLQFQDVKSFVEQFEKIKYIKYDATVNIQDFEKILDELGVVYYSADFHAIKDLLDSERTGKLNLKIMYKWLDENSGQVLTKSMRQSVIQKKTLTRNDEALVTLFKEISKYCQKQNIDLKKDFIAKDMEGKNEIDFSDFSYVLKKNSLNITEEEMNLLKQYCVSQRHSGKIDFQFFLNEINQLYQVSDLELDSFTSDLFKKIRKEFKTIDAFFNAFSKKNVITQNILAKFYLDNQIIAPPKVQQEFFEQMAGKLEDKIIKPHLYQGFKIQVQNLIEKWIKDISTKLEKTGHNFIEYIQKKKKTTSTNIKLEQFYSAFDLLDCGVENKDVDFMLAVFNQVPSQFDEKVNIQQFRKKMLWYGQKYNIKSSYLLVFKGDKDVDYDKQSDKEFMVLMGNDEKMMNQLKLAAEGMKPEEVYAFFEISDEEDKKLTLTEFQNFINFFIKNTHKEEVNKLFDSYSSKKDNKVSAISFLKGMGVESMDEKYKNAEEGATYDTVLFKKYKPIADEVNKLIRKREQKATELFDDKKMPIREFKAILHEKLKFHEELFSDYDQMIDDFRVDDRKINSLQFLALLNYFASNSEFEQEIQTQIIWFKQISENLDEQKDIQTKIYQASKRDGLLKMKEFNDIMENDLGLTTDQKSYKVFVKSILKDKTEYIDYDKFKEGLEKEKKAKVTIQKIIDVSQDAIGAMKVFEQYTQKYPKEKLTLKEFTPMIEVFQKNIDKEEIKYQFYRMDQDKDGFVSRIEFKKSLWQEDKAVEKNYVKPFLKALQKELAQQKTTLDKAFSKKLDNNIISVLSFNNVLTGLDFQYDDLRKNRAIKEIALGSSHEIDWERFKYLWDLYIDQQFEDEMKKTYDKQTENRVYEFGTKMREKMSDLRLKMSLFGKFKNSKTNTLETDEVKTIIREELSINDKIESRFFLNFLDGKDCDKGQITMDNLEKYIDLSTTRKASWELLEERNEKAVIWKKFIYKHQEDFKIEIKELVRKNQDITYVKPEIVAKAINKMNDGKRFKDVNHKEVMIQAVNLDAKDGDDIVYKKFIQGIEKEQLALKKKNITHKNCINEMQQSISQKQFDFEIDFEYEVPPLPPPPPKKSRKYSSDSSESPKRKKGKKRQDSSSSDDKYKNKKKHKKKSSSDEYGSDSDHYKPKKSKKHRDSSSEEERSKKHKKHKRTESSDSDRSKKSHKKSPEKSSRRSTRKQSTRDVKQFLKIYKQYNDNDSDESNSSSQSSSESDTSVYSKKSGMKGKGKKNWRKNEKKHVKKKTSGHSAQKMLHLFKERAKEICEENNYQVRTLFKRFDKANSNDYVSYDEFKKGLKWFDPKQNIVDPNDDDEVDTLFCAIDENADYEIDLTEFRKAILGNLELIDERPILNKIRKEVDTENLQKQFKKMDKNKDGVLDYKEFSQEFSSILTMEQMTKLFNMYAKDSQMSYEQFTELLEQDHLNIKKIQQKLKDKIEQLGLKDYVDLFNYFKSNRRDYMTQIEMLKMMNESGFHFDVDMIEELFNQIDLDHNGKIEEIEFVKAMNGEKQIGEDYTNILKKIRREIISYKNLNFEKYLKKVADKSTGKGLIRFEDFQQMFIQLDFRLTKVEAETVFNQFCLSASGRDGSKKMDYKSFYNQLQKADYDIQKIIDTIKKTYDINEVGDQVKCFDIFSKIPRHSKEEQKVISIKKFDDLLYSCELKMSQPDVKDSFNRFDLDQTGYITSSAFRRVLFSQNSGDWNQDYNFKLLQSHHYNLGGKGEEQKRKFDGYDIKSPRRNRRDESSDDDYKRQKNKNRRDSSDDSYTRNKKKQGGRRNNNYDDEDSDYGNKNKRKNRFNDSDSDQDKKRDGSRPLTPRNYNKKDYIDQIRYQCQKYAKVHPLQVFTMFTKPQTYFTQQKKMRESMQNFQNQGSQFNPSSTMQNNRQDDHNAFFLSKPEELELIFKELDIHVGGKYDIDNFYKEFQDGVRDGPMNYMELCRQICFEEPKNNNRNNQGYDDYDQYGYDKPKGGGGNEQNQSFISDPVEFAKHGLIQVMRFYGKNLDQFFVDVLQFTKRNGQFTRDSQGVPEPWESKQFKFALKKNGIDLDNNQQLKAYEYFCDPQGKQQNKDRRRSTRIIDEIPIQQLAEILGITPFQGMENYIPINLKPVDVQRASRTSKVHFYQTDDTLEQIAQTASQCLNINICDIFTYKDGPQQSDYHYDRTQQLREVLEIFGVQIDDVNFNQFWQTFQLPDEIVKGQNVNASQDRGFNKLNFMNIVRKVENPAVSWKSIMYQVMKLNNMSLQDLFAWGLNQTKSRQPEWTLNEFQALNTTIKLGFEQQELQEMFYAWNLDQTSGISLVDFENYFQLSREKPGQQVGAQYQADLERQVKLLQDFNYNKQMKLKRASAQFNEKNMTKTEYNNNQDKKSNLQQKSQSDWDSKGKNRRDSSDSPDYKPPQKQKSKFQESDEEDNYRNNRQQEQVPQYQQSQTQPQQQQELSAEEQKKAYKEHQRTFDKLQRELKELIDQYGMNAFDESAMYNGFINAEEFCRISNKNYGIVLDTTYRNFAQNFCNEDNRGIHINNMRKKLGVKTQVEKRQSVIDQSVLAAKHGVTKQKAQKKDVNKKLGLQIVAQIKQKYEFEDLQQIFFPDNGKILLGKREFHDRCLQAKPNMTDQQTENLFYFLDNNSSGSVSLSEFKLHFADENDLKSKKNKNNYKAPKHLEEEMNAMYDEIDKDGNGWIEEHELKVLLSSFGINSSQEEIKAFMRKIDKSNDGRIDRSEFKQFIIERMMSDMMTCEDILDDLIRQFKIADVNGTGSLNKEQLNQVFKNLSIQLTQNELNELFDKIDQDGSGEVDIDELALFINSTQEGLSGYAQSAVLNIRSSRKLSLKDLKSTFEGMPENFRSSFTRAKLQKGMNLPSSIFKPIRDQDGYYDLPMQNPLRHNIDDEHIGDNSTNNDTCIELRLDQAVGVPIPEENPQIPRQNLVFREVYVTLFDQKKSTFLGNSCRVSATWTAEYEDRWNFFKKGVIDHNALLIRINNVDERLRPDIQLLFELNLHYFKGSKNQKDSGKKKAPVDLEMSCSFGKIELSELMKPGKKILELQGGEPDKVLTIQDKDIRTNRTGFSYIVKKISKAIKTQLKIETLPTINPYTLQQMKKLPSLYVINKNALPLYYTFRQYAGATRRFHIQRILEQDLIFINFQKIIDCPDIYNYLIYFWKDKILQQLKNIPRSQLNEKFEAMIRHLYLLLQQMDFQFLHADPTASCYCHSLYRERQKLIDSCFDDIEGILGLKSISSLRLTSKNVVAFSMNEFIDEEEDDNLMLEAYQKKSVKVTDTKQI